MLYSISIFIIAALFLFFEMALQVSPGIMTLNLMHSLNIDIFWLGITSGAYFISYTVMQIPAGLLYDRFPPRKVIMAPLLICILGGFTFSLSINIYFAIVGRILMGFGSAFAFIGVLVVASHVFKKKYFTLIAGITQMLASLGAMCGTIPLIPLLNNYGWRSTMVIINSFGIVLLIVMYLFLKLPDNKISPKKLKISHSLSTVIRKKQTWFIAIYSCLLWMPMAVIASLYGIPFAEKYFNLTFNTAASLITLMWIGIAIGAPIAGLLSDFFKKIKITLVICSIIGFVSFTLLLLLPTHNIFLIGIFFLACGSSCSGQAISFSLVSKINSVEHRATAIGFNNMAVVISGFIFQPIVGFVIKHYSHILDNGSTIYSASSYYSGMLIVLTGFALATLISIIFIKEVKN